MPNQTAKHRRLEHPLSIERVYDDDRQAQAAALRALLGLQKPLYGLEGGEAR